MQHAGSHPEKEVIGVLLGKSLGPIMEITDVISYPEASSPERAVLPEKFLYEKIGDEIRERDYAVNVKGYYHSHPPNTFPLRFSSVDFNQYQSLQEVFARKQPFIAIIVNPRSKGFVLLTLDIDGREIRLKPFPYGNLVWFDYAVKKFSDGFCPYRISLQTGEGILDEKFESLLDTLSEKYERKQIVKTMLSNASKYKEYVEKYEEVIANAETLKETFKEARNLYFKENLKKSDELLEQFIKYYVENVSQQIEALENEQAESRTDSAQSITVINQKIHYLMKGAERMFPRDTGEIVGIILDIKKKINELGEPFQHVDIDRSVRVILPPGTIIAETHLKLVEDIIDEKIVECMGLEALEKIEGFLESDGTETNRISFINHLLRTYLEYSYSGTEEQLNDEINEALILRYIKQGYSMNGLFFLGLSVAEDNLEQMFRDDFHNVLADIEDFLKEKIKKDAGAGTLQELLTRVKNER